MKKWVMIVLLGALLCAGRALAQDALRFAEQGVNLYDGTRYETFVGGRVGELTFESNGNWYTVTDASGDSVAWGDALIAKDGFHAEWLPRTLDEARRMNRVRVYLSDFGMLDYGSTVELNRKEKLPVYAAPSEDAWRGANGKAAVSLAEPFRVLADLTEEDGWWMIEYDISDGERRIGYIREPERGRLVAHGMETIPITLTLAEDAAMTDDPHGGGREIARLHAGNTVTCLGYIDALWVMAQTEIDGKAARGFLPMRALDVPEQTPLPDVAAQLTGTWQFIGGAELLGLAGVIFRPDGTLTLCTTDDFDVFPPENLIPDGEPHAFVVYAAPEGRYGNADYVLELPRADGNATRYGFTLEEREDGTVLQLYKGEGGGGYRKVG